MRFPKWIHDLQVFRNLAKVFGEDKTKKPVAKQPAPPAPPEKANKGGLSRQYIASKDGSGNWTDLRGFGDFYR